MTVYFIGAGPGDPELITVKGQRLIRSCPVIIYAGSLVPAAVLKDIRRKRWSTAPNCIWNRSST
jgi:precorrin-4/cobalt-precorrin-4 C11-methyltransferase